MKILHGILLLLCLSLTACASSSPGVAVGFGTHGAGVALFTDSSWLGFGSAGGVMVGLGNGGYNGNGSYSSGRIIRREPAKNPASRPAASSWYDEYKDLSLLNAYRASEQ